MIQETSRIAYHTEVKPTLGRRQMEVMDALMQRRDFTNAELSEFLRWPINTVTPRTNELVKLGIVESAGKRVCGITGRTVMAWRMVRHDTQLELFN